MEKNLKLTSNNSLILVDATTIRQLGGSLIYSTTTHQNIFLDVGVLSRFKQQPRESHLLVDGLKYSKTTYFPSLRYSNLDYASDLEDVKSTSGFLMHLGSAVISWKSKKKLVLALSSAEFEYIAASKETQEILCL